MNSMTVINHIINPTSTKTLKDSAEFLNLRNTHINRVSLYCVCKVLGSLLSKYLLAMQSEMGNP